MVNQSSVTAADLEAGNGVVHVIDTVLVPQNFVYQAVADSTSVPKTGALSLTPFAIASSITLAGAGIVKKRIK